MSEISDSREELVAVEPGVELFYTRTGSGDMTLLLVPGWTMSAEVFQRQLNHYKGSVKVSCVSFDPRSHGRSSKPDHGHTYWHHGRDIAAVIDQLDLKNVVLVGWSFGTLA